MNNDSTLQSLHSGKRTRNGELDFWKFVMSLFVVLVHSYSLFGGKFLVAAQGGRAVEYFFIVTGFLFASSVMRDSRPFDAETIGAENRQFILRKIQGFLWYYILGFFLSFAGLTFLRRLETLHFKNLLWASIDFLLLRETGIPFYDILGVGWYLSSMTCVLFVIYPVFRYRKNLFVEWIAPIFGIGSIGFLCMHFGKVNMPHAMPVGIATGNMIRALGEICLGVVAYGVATRLHSREWRHIEKNIFSCIGLGCMLLACGLMLTLERSIHSHIFILLFFVFVSSVCP